MPRMRKMWGSVLNIKITREKDRSPKKYVELFNDVFSLKHDVKIRGVHWGTLGSMYKLEEKNPTNGLYGYIFRYTKIDENEKWYDEKNRVAVDIHEDGVEIPVKENMQPNLKESVYAFYPEKHRLIFESNGFAPSSAAILLRGLFNNEKIHEKYGEVEVVVESSKQTIQRILRIYNLQNLEIDFTIPNADELGDLEDEIQQRLKGEHVGRIIEIKKSKSDEGIAPNEYTVALMNLAKSNGMVSATGVKENGEKIVVSTEDHPLTESMQYSHETTSRRDAIQTLSARLLSNIFSL